MALFLSPPLFQVFTFLPEGVVLGSWKFVCALIRVKLDEKWQNKIWGTPPIFFVVVEKSESSEMARTLIEKFNFLAPYDDVDDDIDDKDTHDIKYQL